MVSGAMGRAQGMAAGRGGMWPGPVRRPCAPSSAARPGRARPHAPLDPMPDLGVEWPDMDKPDPLPEPGPGEAAEAPAPERAPAEAIEDSAAARRYAWRVDGTGGGCRSRGAAGALQASSRCSKRMRTTRQRRPDRPPRAGRCRAADQPAAVAGLLRCRGRAGIGLRRASRSPSSLQADGRAALYLRGGRAAGARGRRRPGRQVARGVRGQGRATRWSPSEVIAAGVALKVALGEQGFATGRGRRAGHRHRS